MKKIDLTGKRFGRLVVLREELPRTTKVIKWICKCDCGNIKSIRGSDLKLGKTQSCGCLRNERVRETIGNQLKGKRFGHLLVLEQVDSIKENSGLVRTAWKCKCDCGNIVIVKTINLKSGDTCSCGCIHSRGETIIEHILRENNIKYRQQYVFPDLISEKYGYLKFDFAIFDENNSLKYLIEFNGKQHYEPIEYFGGEEQFKLQKKNDKLKQDYCKMHNIPLIIISYKDIENITLNYINERIRLYEEIC